MKRVWLMAVLGACLLGGVARGDDTNAPTVTILQWNVENLFDPQNDPANPADDEFTPTGGELWTEALYVQKLAHLSDVIAGVDADFICVEEIENHQSLKDLAAELRKRHGLDYPHIVHREGPDHRGIDVGILARVAPVTNWWISPVEGQRDILIAQFAPEGAPLTIMVNHWKSWRGAAAECARLRAIEAAAARAEVDKLLAADATARIILVGDFNDNCDAVSIRGGLRSLLDLNKVMQEPEAGWLYNLHGYLPRKERGTLYYARGKSWRSYDNMSVSRALLDKTGAAGRGWRVDGRTYAIVRQPEMLDAEGHPKAFRQSDSRDASSAYVQGYADHLPVRVTLVLQDGTEPRPAPAPTAAADKPAAAVHVGKQD